MKPKTYTVEELRELLINDPYFKSVDDVFYSSVYRFLKTISSREENQKDYNVVDLDNPENNCKFCGVDHHHYERQEQPVKEIRKITKLSHIFKINDPVIQPNTWTVLEKLDEVIDTVNTLLQERSKV